MDDFRYSDFDVYENEKLYCCSCRKTKRKDDFKLSPRKKIEETGETEYNYGSLCRSCRSSFNGSVKGGVRHIDPPSDGNEVIDNLRRFANGL